MRSPGVANSVGRLVSVVTAASGAVPAVTRQITGYDFAGRPTGVTQQVGSLALRTIGHTWNLAGGIAQTVLPSQRTITYGYDAAGRVNGVSGTLSGTSTTYATLADDTSGGVKAYAAHGGIQRLTRGDGITETTVYNTRLQPVSMAAGTLWSASLYYCDNEVAQCGTNNGNLMEQKVTARPDATAAAATFVTTYDYDKANRLCAAVEGAVRIAITTHCDAKQLSANWWQDFAYDTTGNRALLTGSFGTAGNNQPQVSSLATAVPYANFRWSGSGYDARGNVNLLFGASAGAGQQGPGMSYDAENRIVSVTASTMPAISYVYDGEGRRVLKTVGSVTTELVYDGMGELVTEYGGTATASDPTIYLTSDWLGSTRMVTAPASGTSQPKVVELRDYAPFGEELGLAVGGRGVKYAPPTYPSVVPDAVGQKFTGKQRDSESGLDYFGARYMSSAQGRFTSADEFVGGPYEVGGSRPDKPGPLPYADIATPQSLNRYAYALNNPLRYIDPDGHEPSDLVYDGDAHTLTLVSGKGAVVGTWPAANNVAIHAPAGEGNGGYTNGPIENGTYSVTKADQHGATMHLGGSENSAFGSQGIVHVNGAKGATGEVMVGAGVHSGRADKGGPEAKTAGCIRTCTDAVRTINSVAQSDPLKTVTVKYNEGNVAAWQQQAAKIKAEEKKRKQEQN